MCGDALFKESVAIAEPSSDLIPAATKKSAWQITVWVLLCKKGGKGYGCKGGVSAAGILILRREIHRALLWARRYRCYYDQAEF